MAELPICAAISRHSLRVEAALRHAFIADLYAGLWKINCSLPLQVFSADTDDLGFDLVISLNDKFRHVQLKSAFIGSKTAAVSVSETLTKQKGGCVVWCHYDSSSLTIRDYSFLGFCSDEPLNLTRFPLARNIRANAKGIKKVRLGVRKIPKTAFHQNLSMKDVIYCLFQVSKV